MSESNRGRLGTNEINTYLWLGAWHPIILSVGFLLLFAILGLPFGAAATGLVGLLIGVVLWAVGVSHVNEHHSSVLNEYEDYCRYAAEDYLSLSGPETESYRLTDSSGNPPAIEPAREYMTTTIVVGDSSVATHTGVGLEMEYRSPTLEDDTREIYYDQISSVNYSRPNLEITTSNGSTLKFQSSREPDDALEDLQRRLRAYKQE